MSNRRNPFSKLSPAKQSKAVKQSRVWKRILLGLLVIIPVSVISGITANAFREQGVDLVPEYMRNHSLQQIKHIAIDSESMAELSGLLVDARPNHLYKECHAPEAFNFPPGKFNFFTACVFPAYQKIIRYSYMDVHLAAPMMKNWPAGFF